jgi:hypothetical protein
MFETVYALWYWCDGPREGVADCQGRPHVFVSEWDEGADDFGTAFLLKPIDGNTFRLVMEDWAIHERWKAAVSQGLTTFDTHPASPEDRIRTDELKRLLQEPLRVDPARARQSYPVRTWSVDWSSAVSLIKVVRLAGQFRQRPNPVLYGGYELPSLEVRWSFVA